MTSLKGTVDSIGASALEIRPMSGCIGAEIGGVDLCHPLSVEAIAEIRATLLKWKVVFFRGQHITTEQQIAFGRQFGEVIADNSGVPTAIPEFPEVLQLESEGKSEESHFLPGTLEMYWHVDVAYLPDPPMASILRGVIVPQYGGDTQWTNLVFAYQRLSRPIRDMIGQLHGVNVNAAHLARGEELPAAKKAFVANEHRTVHPLVRVHPETGELSLLVSPQHTSHILELSRQESRHLLGLLFDHLRRPEFTVRFRWESGSIAFWDNRATAHIVPTDIPEGARRCMHRVTLAGDIPRGIDGKQSYPLIRPD